MLAKLQALPAGATLDLGDASTLSEIATGAGLTDAADIDAFVNVATSTAQQLEAALAHAGSATEAVADIAGASIAEQSLSQAYLAGSDGYDAASAFTQGVAQAKTHSFTFSDTAAEISRRFDALSASPTITAVVIADNAPLQLSAAQATKDLEGFNKITGPFMVDIVDSAANLAALAPKDIAALGLQPLDAITATDRAISVAFPPGSPPVVTASAEEAVAGVVSGFLLALAGDYRVVFSDSAADVVANLRALAAVLRLGAIKLTDANPSTLTLTVAQLQEAAAALARISSPHAVVVADTAKRLAALKPADLAGLSGLGVTLLQGTDAAPAFSLAQKASLGAAGIGLRQPYANGDYQILTWTAAGAVREIDYFGIEDRPFVRLDIAYRTDGKLASKTWRRADGSIYQKQSWNADGSSLVLNTTSGRAYGADYTSFEIAYDAAGKPLQENWSSGLTKDWRYNSTTSALTEIVVSGIANAIFVKTDTFYAVSGKPAREFWYRSDGGLYQSEIWSDDGSNVLHREAPGKIFGADYSYLDLTYDTAGRRAKETWSNGATQLWRYDDATLALTETIVTGFANPNFVKTDTFYAASGKPAREFWYRGDGSLYQSALWSGDGSRALHREDPGKAYGADYSYMDVNYDAAGKRVQATWSNGATQLWRYDPATDTLTESVVTGIFNPFFVKTDTFFGLDGRPLRETWYRADGSVFQTGAWNEAGVLTLHRS